MMRQNIATICRDTALVIIGLTAFLAAPAIALGMVEKVSETAVDMMPVQLAIADNPIP